MVKIGRNDPCPCGSRKKYKHCCLSMRPQRPLSAQRGETLPVERLLSDGEKLFEKDNCIEACNKWIAAWEIVKTYIDDSVRSIEELDKKLEWPVNLFNWCQDLELELGNAGVNDNSFLRTRINYCREFVERLPDSDENIILNMLRAQGEAYFELGEVEDGEAVFHRLTNSFPDSPWGYIGWGDVYFLFSKEDNKDYQRAEEKYRLALTVAEDKHDREVVEDRLKDLQGIMKTER